MPQADLDATAGFAGQTLELGLTGTEDQAFVRYGKTEYEIPAAVFKQIQAQYEQQQGNEETSSLASLGIDPTKWLTNAGNAGEEKVGDTDTIKITGDVDVPKLLDDVNTAMGKLRSVGGGSAARPSRPAVRAAQAAGRGRDQGRVGGDLHGRRGPDHAAHGRGAQARRARPTRATRRST